MPPQPHGLPHNFVFNKKQLESFKTYSFLANLRVDKWGDFDIVCASINDQHPEIEPSKASSIFKHSLRSINKNTTSTPMRLYTDRMIAFLDKKPIKCQFVTTYSRVMETSAIQSTVDHAKEKNKMKATLVGTLLVENALDKQVQDVRSENTASSSKPISSHQLNSDMAQESTIEPDSDINVAVLDKEDDVDDDADRPAVAITTKDIIGRGAREIHNRYVESSLLSSAERSVMSSGLSGIIDFVNANENGQQQLFAASEWKEMHAKYEQTFNKTLLFTRPSHLSETLTHIIHLCERSKEAAARAYLYKAMDANDSDEDSAMGFKILLQLFSSLSIHCTMLDPLQRIQPTEYDIAFKLWLPLFDQLFAGTQISTRIAETSNTFTSNNKQAMYADSQHHVTAFKIDIRFIHHCHHTSKTIDIAAAEAALDGSTNEKVIADNAKLLREGKDILDSLLNISLEQHAADAMVGIVIQLDGFQGTISSIHLDRDGLYVALPRHQLQYPRSLASLRRFSETLNALLALREQLCSLSIIINNQMELYKDKRSSLGSKHARPSTTIPPHHQSSKQQATWYSPPRDDPSLSRLPFLSSATNED